MQKHFYILPSSDIVAIKKDLERDMGKKLKLWRYKLKRKLHIQAGDTPTTVRARAGQILAICDPEDLEKLLVKWCDEKEQVSQFFKL